MDEKDTNRLEAFSDGVFAVAITLLVLNIKIPGLEGEAAKNGGEFWQNINNALPMLGAYITSFSTIGIMWLNHHRLFQHIKHNDTGLILMNLLLLMIIVFIPVPTALLAANFDASRDSQIAAAVFYSGTFFVMACCYNILWRYASFRGRLLGKNVDMKAVKAIDRQYLFGPVVYFLNFGLAWLSLQVSVIFALLLVLFFALPSKVVLTHTKDERSEATLQQSAQDGS